MKYNTCTMLYIIKKLHILLLMYNFNVVPIQNINIKGQSYVCIQVLICNSVTCQIKLGILYKNKNQKDKRQPAQVCKGITK